MGDAPAKQTSLSALLHASVTALSHGRLPPQNIVAMLISKALGFAIIAGGSVVKLPQISALLKSGSAAGLAVSAFELENLGFIIYAAYGYLLGLPISSYGEAVVMLLQNTLLLVLIYRYAKAGWLRSAAVLGLNAAAIASVLTGRISVSQIRAAYDLNSVIMTAARVPQIIQNFRTKNTGQLSIVTYAANSLGCIARIFTSYQDGGGMSMIRAFLLALVLNATIAAQIMVYRPKKARGKKE